MIDWVDLLASAWGRYLRGSPNGWPNQSAMWNVAFHSVSNAADIWIPNMPPKILEFHCAWHAMEGKYREALWNHYVTKSPQKQQSPEYRDQLHTAHKAVIRRLIEKDGVANE